MFLTEQSAPATGALPVSELRAHLRLGTGFTDDTLQDAQLVRCLSAAMAQVEALTGKAVLRRGFVWTLNAWRDLGRQALPRAPLTELRSITIHDPDGTSTDLPSGAVHVEHDAHRPSLVAKGFTLPAIPVGGRAEIAFTAGFADPWSDVPADLSLAILSLAAALYEDRARPGEMPAGVHALIAPYRQPRFLRAYF